MKGKLIVLDGLDGSGKATHSKLIVQNLLLEWIPAQRVTFPNYEEPSSALVKMYLGGEFGSDPLDVNAYAASSFYAVDRFASYKKHWGKNLEAGETIVVDRYTTSNAIHQMAKIPKEQWDDYLHWLFDFEFDKLGLPKPDKVLYLDMLPEISQKLIEKRYDGDNNKKDIHEKDFSYLLCCREAALYCSEKLGWERILLCDENGPFDKMVNFQKIYEKVLQTVR